MLLIVLLNVALCVFVIFAIVGMQLWAIVSSSPRGALPALRLRRPGRRQRFSGRPRARELAGLRLSR